MRSILALIGVSSVLLIGRVSGDLSKEAVYEGDCVKIPYDNTGDQSLFTSTTQGGHWYIVMGSGYGIRFHSELLNNHPPQKESDLDVTTPAKLINYSQIDGALTVTMGLGLPGKSAIKIPCRPDVLQDSKEFECDAYNTSFAHGEDFDTPGVKWRLLAHPKATVIKIDSENEYMIIHVCNPQVKARYWFILAKKPPTPVVVEKIKKEVKETGKYNVDLAYVINFK